MKRILLLTGALLMAPVADAQTLSVVWNPPVPSALPPPSGFNVYRNHLKLFSVSATTTRALLPQPYLPGDVVEVSSFLTDANGQVFESARVATCFPSIDGAMIPPSTFLLDSACHTWTIEMATTHILRDTVWIAGGLGQQLLWRTAVIYALGTDSNWYSFGDATGWVNVGPTQPGGAPPQVDVCVTLPLHFSVSRWPAGTTGTRRFDYYSDRSVQIQLDLRTTPWKAVATDTRGCTITVTR